MSIKNHCNDFFRRTFNSSNGKYHLLLLNSKSIFLDLVAHSWNQFSTVVCADGAANRLYDYSQSDKLKFLPHFIVGDLDSLKMNVAEFYRSDYSLIKVWSKNNVLINNFLHSVGQMVLSLRKTKIKRPTTSKSV